MGLRTFLRALRRRETRPKHGGDELADEIRDAIGSQGGGGFGSGRATGHAAYRYLEDRERD